MSKSLQWTLGIGALLVVAAVIFSTVWPFFAPRSGWGGYGMMGPGQMMGGAGMMGGGGMMGGFGIPLFGFGMLLVPLLFIGLVVVGVVWLARNVGTSFPSQPPVASLTCANCGKPLQSGWKACPYCGEKV